MKKYNRLITFCIINYLAVYRSLYDCVIMAKSFEFLLVDTLSTIVQSTEKRRGNITWRSQLTYDTYKDHYMIAMHRHNHRDFQKEINNIGAKTKCIKTQRLIKIWNTTTCFELNQVFSEWPEMWSR